MSPSRSRKDRSRPSPCLGARTSLLDLISHSPELFDLLSKDWASLNKFHRARGVPRFMANVIGSVWQIQVGDPLIMPARAAVV
jgi:hypothetical protein